MIHPLRTFRLLLLFLPCALLSFTNVIGQLTISGKVVNGATGSPLPGASVYFNNTSIGTSSNEKGEFSFTGADITNGELIVSSIGYEILVLKLNTTQANGKYFLCQLTPRNEDLKDVLILTDARRKKLLEIFKQNFLGLTREADRSSMLNLENIYFARGNNQQGFKAYADTPLIIINRLLGYQVSFQLVEFSFDDSSGTTYFYGYTRYEEMGDKKRWAKNRREAYLGSTLHFFRSLLGNKLSAEGYDLYLVKPPKEGSASSAPAIAITVTPGQLMVPNESDSSLYRITVPGKLMVQYRRNPASKMYLSKKFMLQGSMPVGFRAYINLNAPYFLIDRNGIMEDPLSVNYGGYWMYERAANLLPFNYQPE